MASATINIIFNETRSRDEKGLYNHLCVLMLNVSFLLQRGGYRFGYSRKLVVLVYVVFGRSMSSDLTTEFP